MYVRQKGSNLIVTLHASHAKLFARGVLKTMAMANGGGKC